MDLLTTSEVADYLRLKERTVYEMVSRHQIPCSRATGKLLFSRSLINAWVEAHTEMPGGQAVKVPAIYSGSSEPLLEWSLRQSGSGLAVLSSGSRRGLDKIASGEAVLAGVHLFDAETQSYNIAQVRVSLPQHDIVVVHWARRVQGLIVAAGNPRHIRDLNDVVKRGLIIARRNEGAGSQVLLHELLRQSGIPLHDVKFTEAEAESEPDISGMIAMGRADCALGIKAVAKPLDFIPLWPAEEFDLVMRRRDYFEPAVQALLEFSKRPEFVRHADYLGGYDLSELGAVRYNA